MTSPSPTLSPSGTWTVGVIKTDWAATFSADAPVVGATWKIVSAGSIGSVGSYAGVPSLPDGVRSDEIEVGHSSDSVHTVGSRDVKHQLTSFVDLRHRPVDHRPSVGAPRRRPFPAWDPVLSSTIFVRLD